MKLNLRNEDTQNEGEPEDPPAYSVIDEAPASSFNMAKRLSKPFTRTPCANPSRSTNTASGSGAGTGTASNNNNYDDNRYAFLTKFDTVILVDDSYSMTGARWEEVAAALRAIAPICTKYDKDGIDICFLNHKREYKNVCNAAMVSDIFASVRPCGATFTGQRLRKILTGYLNEYATAVQEVLRKHPGAKSIADLVYDDDDDDDNDGNGRNVARTLPKPLNIIVLTDGEPSDDVESVIIAAARKLDKLDAPAWQVGIQFFQIGQDEQARRHLKRLDDELDLMAGTAASGAGEGLRDMVDTVPYAQGNRTITAEGILKVVLGAVHRRYDRSDGTSGKTRLHG